MSQRSSTWTQRKDSQQRLGCLSPQRPAVSDSSTSDSACWSFSWQTAALSPCVEPDRQLCGINSWPVSCFIVNCYQRPVEIEGKMLFSGDLTNHPSSQIRYSDKLYNVLTHRLHCWLVLSSQSPVHRVYADTAVLCWGCETEDKRNTTNQNDKNLFTCCKDGADQCNNLLYWVLTESSVSGVSAMPLSQLVSWAISTDITEEHTEKRRGDAVD